MASLIRTQTYKDKKINIPLRVSHNLFVLGIIASFAICMIYTLTTILTTTPKPLENINISLFDAYFGHDSQKMDYKHLLEDIDEKYRKKCLNILQGKTNIDPQTVWTTALEDWYIYNNFFKDDAYHSSSSKRKKSFGVYVDIGNYMPFQSDTAFFDFCLGWAGMCIWSPNAVIDFISPSDRSCNTISNECLWKADRKYGGHADAVKCRTVDRYAKDILKEYEFLDKFGNSYEMERDNFTIDYVSLSVEGAEVSFLECWDFDELQVTVWSIRTLGEYKQMVDDLMLGKGYIKFDQLSFDGSTPAQIFVRRDAVYPYNNKTEYLFRTHSTCTMVNQKK